MKWPTIYNITFANPGFLLLLGLIPLLAFWYYYRRKSRYASFQFSNLQAFGGKSSLRGLLRSLLLPAFRLGALSLFIIALARPQATLKEEEVKAEGIDIMLVTDISSSMLAKDFKPNRLEASKKVAKDFIAKRKYDRIGLTVFAGEAFTQCPLTTDHTVINNFLTDLKVGILEDGTAIGLGLASAVNRLKESEAKSKIVIMLTDGENNAGEYVKPLTAAEIAKELGVKVYTIGVGTIGRAMAPVGRRGNGEYVFGMAQVRIDEKLLKEIANMTNALYFRATNLQSLEAVYNQINQLEKTEIEVTTIKRYSEEFYPWVLLGLILLALETLLRYTLFRTIF